MQTSASSVRSVVNARNKFTWTAEVLWREGIAWPLYTWESALTLAWTGFLGALHQGRSSFIMLRFALSDYFLQITKKRMLQMQGNDKSDWSGYIPSLEWLSKDFKELLQRYTLNICCLNSGWGSLSKSKPQSSLDIMQAWSPRGTTCSCPGLHCPPALFQA